MASGRLRTDEEEEAPHSMVETVAEGIGEVAGQMEEAAEAAEQAVANASSPELLLPEPVPQMVFPDVESCSLAWLRLGVDFGRRVFAEEKRARRLRRLRAKPDNHYRCSHCGAEAGPGVQRIAMHVMSSPQSYAGRWEERNLYEVVEHMWLVSTLKNRAGKSLATRSSVAPTPGSSPPVQSSK